MSSVPPCLLRGGGARALPARTTGRRGDRQLEREGAPPAWLAVGPDPPAMRLDHRTRDGEPDPGPAVVARTRLVHPVKALEHVGQVLGRDTRARVGDDDVDRTVVARR